MKIVRDWTTLTVTVVLVLFLAIFTGPALYRLRYAFNFHYVGEIVYTKRSYEIYCRCGPSVPAEVLEKSGNLLLVRMGTKDKWLYKGFVERFPGAP